MPDNVRRLLERGVEGYVPPRDALDRAIERAKRRRTRRRAAAAIVAIGLSVTAGGLLLRAFPQTGSAPRSPSPSAHAEDTPSNELKDVHRLLERVLADLWTTTVVADELEGEVQAGRAELAALGEDGKGGSPAARRLSERILALKASALQKRAQEIELRVMVDGLRERRESLIPLVDPAAFPDVVTVTCAGDATGGTSISTPLVRAGPANSLQFRVVNEISNERVFLRAKGLGVLAVIEPGSSQESLITDVGGLTLQLVCTYEQPSGATARPAHPVTVADEDQSSLPCEVGTGSDDVRDTKFGHWLIALLQRTGAPEGWAVPVDAIGEWSGEIVLRLPEYAGRFRLSLFAEPPDRLNVEIGTIPVIGRAEGLTFRATDIPGFQQYIVVGEGVWITTHVLPGRERISDKAMTDWFRDVVRAFQQVPPPSDCT
jgi:hypothetical protein